MKKQKNPWKKPENELAFSRNAYRLRELRKSKAWSQSDLGKYLGVSKVSVSGYEKGTRVPSMDILLTILKLFDVSADFMLGSDLTFVNEDGSNNQLLISDKDIEIIKEIRKSPKLYNRIAANPNKFFETAQKY